MHSNEISKHFILSTLVSSFVFLLSGNFIYKSFFPRAYQQQVALQEPLPFKSDPASMPALPQSWIDPQIKTPLGAKKDARFWGEAYHSGHIGTAALRILEHPDFFKQVFPGYGEDVRLSSDFWKNYFSNVFNSGTWFPSLAQESKGIFIRQAYDGCLDLLEKFGANIVIVGSSEIFNSVIPFILAKELAAGDLKILNCSISGMHLDDIPGVIKALSKSPYRPALFVWGFSVWEAQSTSPFFNNIMQSREKEMHAESWYHKSLTAIFPEFNWNSIFTPNFQRIRSETSPNAKKSGFFAPIALLQSSLQSEEWARQYKHPTWLTMDGITESNCELSSISNKIDQFIDQLLKNASNLLIYEPPTTPLHLRSAPDCFAKSVEKMLNSKENRPHVFVKTPDWRDFGLEYADFATPTGIKEIYKIDPDHTNYKGALKVSIGLAAYIRNIFDNNSIHYLHEN